MDIDVRTQQGIVRGSLSAPIVLNHPNQPSDGMECAKRSTMALQFPSLHIFHLSMHFFQSQLSLVRTV